ncbi:MAG: peptidylprolyl isomerase [Prevotella sp.]|nr:peptidylprolyl isomerase [Prevotella sp.]
MNIKNRYIVAALLVLGLTANAGRMMYSNGSVAQDTDSIVNPHYLDEVVWVVGDEAILLSDIEMMRLQAEQEGIDFGGDPDCRIPEQIAVQKLFLHQAALDSIEVSEAEVSSRIDQQINAWIQMVGSKEKLEEYRKMSITQMRQDLHDDFKNRQLVEKMREKLVEDVKVTPADVRAYFRNLPEDSIPYVPTEVEVQILTQQPRIPMEDINKVKDDLREYTERVTSGNTSFGTLARLYSEDPGTARQGGELDYTGRGMLDPAFAAVAFNLTDPKKISKIVESEFGFHIIQLIDKRGDKIKVRHILRKPKVPQSAIDDAMVRLDSIGDEIRAGKFTFDEGATYISDDKDTRNNYGIMSNMNEDGHTSKFQMRDLPTEIARVVDTLKVGGVSKSFSMINQKGKTVCAIVKLKSRTEGHRATITEDFQVMKNVVLNNEKEKFIREWVKKKIGETYVRMDDRYKNCNFEYEGWVRE